MVGLLLAMSMPNSSTPIGTQPSGLYWQNTRLLRLEVSDGHPRGTRLVHVAGVCSVRLLFMACQRLFVPSNANPLHGVILTGCSNDDPYLKDISCRVRLTMGPSDCNLLPGHIGHDGRVQEKKASSLILAHD